MNTSRAHEEFTKTWLAHVRRAGQAILFTTFPAAAAAGGLALAPFLGLAGAACVRPAPVLRAVRFANPVGALILLLICWFVASSLWSPVEDKSQAVRLMATALPGLLLAAEAGADASTRRWFRIGFAAAIAMLCVLLGLEALSNMALNRIASPDAADWEIARNPGRGASVLVTCGWGVAGALFAHGSRGAARLGLALLALMAGFATQFMQIANIAAFGAGLVAYLLALLAGRFAVWGVSALLAAFALGAPALLANPRWADLLGAPFPIEVRAQIWAYASELIGERRWLGHGLDAARLYSKEVEIGGSVQDLMPLHPHNASLQIWLETGAVGAALAAAVLLVGGWVLAKRMKTNRHQMAAACATLASFGLLANSTYGAWQEWWIATACIAAACVASMPSPAKH